MHTPVLLREVIKYLAPDSGENFIDCTINGGGHSSAILQKISPEGKLLGIDWDEQLLLKLKFKMKAENLILVCDNFANLKDIVEKYNFRSVNGILFDLGMSSWHLEKSQRGFSFLREEPLDMRYRPQSQFRNLSAGEVVNSFSRLDLKEILQQYGEEKFAGRIAEEIVRTRKKRVIATTFDLVEVVKRAAPRQYQKEKIHPATRTFQALRIYVNKELDNLLQALPQALEILESAGRLVIISFHSLEDRLAKNFFRTAKQEGKLKILTKKPVRPTLEEVTKNPRSRSAKLRAAIKI